MQPWPGGRESTTRFFGMNGVWNRSYSFVFYAFTLEKKEHHPQTALFLFWGFSYQGVRGLVANVGRLRLLPCLRVEVLKISPGLYRGLDDFLRLFL